MLNWDCRQCGESLEAPESLGRETINCPACGTPSRPERVGDAGSRSGTKPTEKAGGLFDALLGNVTGMDPGEAHEEVRHLLVPGERVELAYKLIRDLVVFTDRRLILIDKQGLTGKKVECHSVPYKSIAHFSVETAGTFDRDSEMKIYVSGSSMPIETQFRKGGADIFDVQRTLALAVVGS